MSNIKTSPVSPATVPTVDTKAILVKAVIFLVLAVAGAAIFAIPAVKEQFHKTGPLAAWFRGLGSLGMVTFVLGSAALILVGVPRLALCPIAGVLYGFWIGLTLSVVSTMISYYAAFVWIRGRQHKGLSRAALPSQLAFLTGDPGIAGVMLSRCIPAPGMLVTMALALSSVSPASYLLGSAIGLIPEAVPAVIFGSGMNGGFKKDQMALLLCGGFVAIVGAWMLINYLTRRARRATPAIESINQ